MAIFYNHIKGCGVGSTGNGEKDAWTGIQMASVGDQESKINGDADFKFAPSILANSTNNTTGRVDFGHIITEKGINQHVGPIIHFDNGIISEEVNTPSLITREISYGDPSSQSGSGLLWTKEKRETADQYISKTTVTSDKVEFNATNIQAENARFQTKEIKANDKCEALYFNATSDRRAKTNILPSQFKGLDIVNALSVYNFDYKSTGTPSIGIMAQDAAIQDLGSFNLVDNLNASGEDNDFMSIKESKLVYVLWKAVQELSAEVKRLESIVNTTCTRKMK